MTSWEMYAGRDQHNGGFKNFGGVGYVMAYGHAEPVQVVVSEEPEGTYYGWIDARRAAAGDDTPAMIQQFSGLFAMQFTYGPEAEVNAGRGRIVRLAVKEAL